MTLKAIHIHEELGTCSEEVNSMTDMIRKKRVLFRHTENLWHILYAHSDWLQFHISY